MPESAVDAPVEPVPAENLRALTDAPPKVSATGPVAPDPTPGPGIGAVEVPPGAPAAGGLVAIPPTQAPVPTTLKVGGAPTVMLPGVTLAGANACDMPHITSQVAVADTVGTCSS